MSAEIPANLLTMYRALLKQMGAGLVQGWRLTKASCDDMRHIWR